MVAVATDNSLFLKIEVKCAFNNKNFHKKDVRKHKDGSN